MTSFLDVVPLLSDALREVRESTFRGTDGYVVQPLGLTRMKVA
jgi:hypothetical protein